jgi:CubicO group peptidase (beta-lactamase class C family)
MTAHLPAGVDGTCDDRFAEIPRILAEQLESGQHHGTAIAIRHRGQPVVDIWGGPEWREDTMAISFSTTKGITATLCHMVLERAGVSYDTPVCEVWPEFGVKGKDTITIRHLLCHEAGIPQIKGEVDRVEDLADWETMVGVMERLEPLWEPGTENGYHAVNYGWLVGEVIRRVDGRPFQEILRDELAGPLGLDGLYIGTPESEHHRIAPLVHPPMPTDFEGGLEAKIAEFLGPDHLLLRALNPFSEDLMTPFLGSALGMSACGPAFTGAFTARSLATVYAALERGGTLNGVRLLSPETIATATTVQNHRPDRVLVMPIHWRLGYMSGGSGISPAGPNREAYGHSGLGGSIAMADPKAELSVALVLDRLEPNLMGDDRGRRIVDAAIAAVA